jgi:hypothetical protein
MPYGIAELLSIATGTVKAADTLTTIVKRYQKKQSNSELAALLQAVKQTAVTRVEEADQALTQFERALKDKGIDMSTSLAEAIDKTPLWRPFEIYQLRQLKKRFDASTDSIGSSIDDIDALVRCQENTSDMRQALVESLKAKREFEQRMLNSSSIKESIEILREEIEKQRLSLGPQGGIANA